VESEIATTEKVKQYNAPFVHSEFTEGAFFTNGHQLICLYPTAPQRKGVDSIAKARVFSILDGKFLGDHNIKAIPGSTTATYDYKNNLIWTYSHEQRKVNTFLNIGVSPRHTFIDSESMTDTTVTSLPSFRELFYGVFFN
jgi:hypothetical protein